MTKNLFKRREYRYGFYGVLIGILFNILDVFLRKTDVGINIILALMRLPTLIISIIKPCPYTGFGCLYYGVDFALFTSPLYLGLLGFLIGLVMEKLRKND